MQLGCGCVVLFDVGCDELVPFSVYVDDFYLVVVFEMLAELGDVYVHGPCVEVVVVDPDGLEGEVSL